MGKQKKNNLIKFPGQEPERQSKILKQYKSLIIIGALLLTVAVALVVAYRYIINNYTVTTVYVDGNLHYTSEQIMDMVMEGKYGNNSLFLSLKYKDKSIRDIPFIQKMDITVMAKDTIKINVYEKALAGYVEYLGHYLYFDRDGIVVESSQVTTSDIPQVTGLNFDYAVLYERLPVEDETVFTKILGLTQLLKKYNIEVDKIFFGENQEIFLYFGQVRVDFGTDENIDEKVMQLENILPNLEGKSGVLLMENYNADTKETIFESDSQKN